MDAEEKNRDGALALVRSVALSGRKEKVFWWSGIRKTNLCVHSELQSATRKHIARNKGHNKTIVFLASLVIFLPLLLPFFFFFFSLGSSTSVASFFPERRGGKFSLFSGGKNTVGHTRK